MIASRTVLQNEFLEIDPSYEAAVQRNEQRQDDDQTQDIHDTRENLLPEMKELVTDLRKDGVDPQRNRKYGSYNN